MITGLSKKAAKAMPAAMDTSLAPLHVLIAMSSALIFSIPVTWIYTLTHKKKGWKQGTVQSLVALPVVIAGIVVLLKYSLPLAFGMAEIVAAFVVVSRTRPAGPAGQSPSRSAASDRSPSTTSQGRRVCPSQPTKRAATDSASPESSVPSALAAAST